MPDRRRSEVRAKFDDATRVQMLEDDMDEFFAELEKFKRSMEAKWETFTNQQNQKFDAFVAEIKEDQRWTRRAFMGLLVSMVLLLFGTAFTVIVATAGG